jgi:CheY-like chemotaxis protein
LSPPPTILFIEDNEDDIFFLLRAARRLSSPLNAITARDGAEAVELLEKMRAAGERLPDAIVTDLKMPIRTGYEFLAWRQENDWVAVIPAYVLSSSELERDKERAASLKATAYFVKPERADQLTATIGAIVNLCCRPFGTA